MTASQHWSLWWVHGCPEDYPDFVLTCEMHRPLRLAGYKGEPQHIELSVEFSRFFNGLMTIAGAWNTNTPGKQIFRSFERWFKIAYTGEQAVEPDLVLFRILDTAFDKMHPQYAAAMQEVLRKLRTLGDEHRAQKQAQLQTA